MLNPLSTSNRITDVATPTIKIAINFPFKNKMCRLQSIYSGSQSNNTRNRIMSFPRETLRPTINFPSMQVTTQCLFRRIMSRT